MMLIDGCDGVIWPIWYVLGWICGWDVVNVNKWLAFAQLLSQNLFILAIHITNQYPASPYHHPSICPYDAN
jgi:hypothetical protein